jgi:uncharacterized protein YaaQ
MKLLLSVINSDDTYSLTDALVDQGYRSTVISTTGGFLREGNTTLLIGIDDHQVPAVLRIIKDTCRTRTKLITSFPPEIGELLLTPIEVEVGGAVVFVVPVERFERF